MWKFCWNAKFPKSLGELLINSSTPIRSTLASVSPGWPRKTKKQSYLSFESFSWEGELWYPNFLEITKITSCAKSEVVHKMHIHGEGVYVGSSANAHALSLSNWGSKFILFSALYPVDTRRRFNVCETSIRRRRRYIDVF